MLAGAGFAPVQVLLPSTAGDAQWLFVSLAAEPGEIAAPCFTAVFSGSVFNFTPLMVRKCFSASTES